MCFKEIKNKFFREATLRLYSNLDIEKGLCECVRYLKKFMPADGLYLQKVEKEYNAFRIMVRATSEKGETVDILAPLPREARDAITQLENDFKNSKLPNVIVVNNPEEEPITSVVQKYLEVPPSSVLSMPLAIVGRVPATLALIAEGSNRYTEEHVKLFEVFKEPFFFVVSNNLKHKEWFLQNLE